MNNQVFSSDNIPSIISPPIEHLVDREEQLDKFTNILDRILRGGPVYSNLFEWYGSPGIGKSTLLSMLTHQADVKRTSWAAINFRNSAEKKKIFLYDPVLLIEEIINSLKMQVGLDTGELDLAISGYRKANLPEYGVVLAFAAMDQETRLYKRPDWLAELRNVVGAFIKLVNTLPSYAKTGNFIPVVLFFDETEYANIELIDWIEEWIINPLIQIKHCVIVWTARRPWRWKRPEIRRRLTSEPLEVFNPEIVKELIQSGSAKPDLGKELFRNVFVISGGHPFASFIVINELGKLAEEGEIVTPENFSKFEAKLLEDVFNKFIKTYAFNELNTYELKIACNFIALVRLFDSTMLREILQACAGPTFKSWNQDDFGRLLLQLKKTQLLVWEKGYAIDGSLRRILQRYFMILEKETFIEANRAALRVYDDWLARPVDSRGLFVLEELYHSAALYKVGEHMDLEVILTKRVREYPAWIADKQALDNALERLEGEISNDKDLEQLLASNAELEKLVQVVRDERLS